TRHGRPGRGGRWRTSRTARARWPLGRALGAAGGCRGRRLRKDGLAALDRRLLTTCDPIRQHGVCPASALAGAGVPALAVAPAPGREPECATRNDVIKRISHCHNDTSRYIILLTPRVVLS